MIFRHWKSYSQHSLHQTVYKVIYVYKLFVNMFCRVYLHENSQTNTLDNFYNLLIA